MSYKEIKLIIRKAEADGRYQLTAYRQYYPERLILRRNTGINNITSPYK